MPLRSILVGPLTAVLLLTGLTACESKEAPKPAVASPVERFSTTPVFETPIVGKGLMERWGEDRVTKMLTEFTAYVRAESWNIERLRPKADYIAADFSSVPSRMTFDLSLEWSDLLASALRGDEQDAKAVRALTFWDMGGDGFTFAPTGPFVVDERVGSVLMLDERSHGVRVTVAYSANIRMLKNGEPYLRLVKKQLFVKIMMVNADGWAIDHFDGTWRVGDARPE